MHPPATWQVSFHNDFDAAFDTFTADVQDALLAAAAVLRQLGPAADRPLVGPLNHPSQPDMKELRFKADTCVSTLRRYLQSPGLAARPKKR